MAGGSGLLARLDFPYGSILLQKYFGGVERNLQELLLRFSRSDARDYITSPKNDHGASYRHYGASALRNRPKLTFARFLASFDFRLFQHYRSLADVHAHHDRRRLHTQKRTSDHPSPNFATLFQARLGAH